MTPEGRRAFIEHVDQLRYRCGRPLGLTGFPCPGRLRHTPVLFGEEPSILSRCSVCDILEIADRTGLGPTREG